MPSVLTTPGHSHGLHGRINGPTPWQTCAALNPPDMTSYQPRYDRLIISLGDDELERFVREWVLQKKEYTEVERFTGTGDMGRDVVGFLTKHRHEGSWHNYQCKQYGKTLPTDAGLREVGKVLYHSSRGEFTPPTAFFFVAPRGVNRNLKRLIAKPEEFRQALLDRWESYFADGISDGLHVPLDSAVRMLIQTWDFSLIRVISVDMMLSDPAAKPVLGADPGPAPAGTVPTVIESYEMPYIQQLLDAYGEREQRTFADYAEANDHVAHGPHIRMQRERFFDADAFSRFYRDNTMSEEIAVLRRDMLHGVFDKYSADHRDSLARVEAVMTQAANVHPSGALAKYARVTVKQGICHHFANEGQLRWRMT
jgi:C-terminal domain 6 of the ABC-three component (ABC-3C) systems